MNHRRSVSSIETTSEVELKDLKDWQYKVAFALGYVNHAEGQSGYEVVSADKAVEEIKKLQAKSEESRKASMEEKKECLDVRNPPSLHGVTRLRSGLRVLSFVPGSLTFDCGTVVFGPSPGECAKLALQTRVQESTGMVYSVILPILLLNKLWEAQQNPEVDMILVPQDTYDFMHNEKWQGFTKVRTFFDVVLSERRKPAPTPISVGDRVKILASGSPRKIGLVGVVTGFLGDSVTLSMGGSRNIHIWYTTARLCDVWVIRRGEKKTL